MILNMTPDSLVVRTADVINGNLWRCFPVINVDKVEDIPCDYPGAMGVPITFMSRYIPEHFEILDCPQELSMENGRKPYQRIIVRNLHPALSEEIDLAEWFRCMGVPLDVRFMKAEDDLPDDATLACRSKQEGAK